MALVAATGRAQVLALGAWGAVSRDLQRASAILARRTDPRRHDGPAAGLHRRFRLIEIILLLATLIAVGPLVRRVDGSFAARIPPVENSASTEFPT